MNAKWLGWISGVICCVLLTTITFLFQVNLLVFITLGKLPVYYWVLGLLVFYVWVYFKKNGGRKPFNTVYLFVVVFSFVYLNSMLHWSIECCPENYESMSEWSAAKSLAWIIHLPFSFFIVIIQGIVFDLIRK
jgi:hypothetical protein